MLNEIGTGVSFMIFYYKLFTIIPYNLLIFRFKYIPYSNLLLKARLLLLLARTLMKIAYTE